MRLFLASSLNCSMREFDRVASSCGKRVLFVGNAADPYEGLKPWVQADLDVFRRFSYQVEEVDLRKISTEELKIQLSNVDILHVAGGSVYYLTHLLRGNGFGQIIIEAVVNNQIIYTGSSAGSIVASHTIEPFSRESEEMRFISLVPDHKGLGMIDFGIVPHCDSVDFISENVKVVERLPICKQAMFFLQDTQALWIENDRIEFCAAGK